MKSYSERSVEEKSEELEIDCQCSETFAFKNLFGGSFIRTVSHKIADGENNTPGPTRTWNGFSECEGPDGFPGSAEEALNDLSPLVLFS